MASSSSSLPSPPKVCGMCGACNSMPPWAPEALATATPAARKAIQLRMKEKQQTFLAIRNARLEKERELKQQAQDTIETDTTSSSNTDVSENEDSQQSNKYSSGERSISEKPAQDNIKSVVQIEQNGSQLISQHDDLRDENRKPNISHPIIAPVLSTTSTSMRMNSSNLADMDSDADSFHTADDEDEDLKVNDSYPSNHFGLDDVSLDNIIDQNGTIEQPLNSLPDPPSSSTVNDEVHNELDPECNGHHQSLGNNNNHYSNTSEAQPSPAHSPSSLAGSQIFEHSSSHSIQKHETNKLSTNSDKAIETITMEETTLKPKPSSNLTLANSDRHKFYSEDMDSFASDNLEQFVFARRSNNGPKRRPSFQPTNSMNTLSNNQIQVTSSEDLKDDDLVEIKDDFVSKDVVQCKDCQAWRKKVVELEEKVESLSSAITAKEMDLATLRARLGDAGRNVPRSEARLLQECESLRVTTEFLFQKLERYEKTINGSKAEIH